MSHPSRVQLIALGVTLLEMMVSLVIVGIVIITVLNTYFALDRLREKTPLVPDPVVQSKCVKGVLHLVDSNGTERPVLDDFGKQVSCK